MRDFVEAVRRATAVVSASSRFFTHNRAFDISKARTKIGYDPKWQEEAGLVEAIKWYKQEGYL